MSRSSRKCSWIIQNLAKPPLMRICRGFENLRDLRALSGKFLRQKSCCPESFCLFWLCLPYTFFQAFSMYFFLTDKYLSSTKYFPCFSSFILLLLDKNLKISLSKSLILFLDCPKHFPLFNFPSLFQNRRPYFEKSPFPFLFWISLFFFLDYFPSILHSSIPFADLSCWFCLFLFYWGVFLMVETKITMSSCNTSAQTCKYNVIHQQLQSIHFLPFSNFHFFKD